MKYKMSLRIFGEFLNPEKVTEDLKMVPDVCHRKGDTETKYSKRGKKIGTVIYRQGMWGKDFDCANADFSEALEQFYKEYAPYKKFFDWYTENEMKVELFIGLWYGKEETKFVIEEDYIARLSQAGIGIDVDEYWI